MLSVGVPHVGSLLLSVVSKGFFSSMKHVIFRHFKCSNGTRGSVRIQFISSVFIFIAALASRLYFQVSVDFVLVLGFVERTTGTFT